MNATELLAFMRAQKWAVQASVTAERAPQAAVIGVAITDAFELVFDTVASTRKAINLRSNPNIALVLGWDDGQTLQYEGVADEPHASELDGLRRLYLARFPDGAERIKWPGITYFRVRPTWMRYSDFRADQPRIHTWTGHALQQLISSPPA